MQSAYGLGGGWDWKEMAKEFMGGIGIENDMRERVWVESGTKNNMRSVYGRGLKEDGDDVMGGAGTENNMRSAYGLGGEGWTKRN
jgi:hypothetical protein